MLELSDLAKRTDDPVILTGEELIEFIDAMKAWGAVDRHLTAEQMASFEHAGRVLGFRSNRWRRRGDLHFLGAFGGRVWCWQDAN